MLGQSFALAALVVVCLQDVCAQTPGSTTFPPGDVRNCFPNEVKGDVNRFEVLPGSGWDNLRNAEAGMVVALNYSQCRTTDDGRYVIPDTVNVYPIKTSRVDSFAEVIDDYTDYVSTLSKDINVDAGFKGIFDISGTFDDDYTNVKKRQLTDDSFTTRVQARYVRYRSVLQPDMPLEPAFKYRLMSIAGALELDNQRQARFDAQQLVREFGTHVSTGVDAGAAIVQEEQISNDMKKKSTYSERDVKVAAGFSFTAQIGNLFAGASASTVNAGSFYERYLMNRTDSLVKAHGGSVVNKTNTTIEDWVKEMSNDLVAIGRSGEPIFNFINAQTVPELPASTLLQLVAMVRESVYTYYKVNTHPGCTDRTALNFSPRSNVDDGSCRPPLHNTTFGGVYQTCNHTQVDAGDICKELVQTNPATGSFECPSGYEAVPLYSGSKTRQQVDHVCGHCFLIFGHCCHDVTSVSSANYETFWCAPMDGPEAKTGYLFGGVYTSHLVNPVTSEMTCPHSYVGLRMGENIRVCVSDQFDDAEEYSVPFAGFFSCSAGNPLAIGSVMTSLTSHMYTQGPSQWPRKCPVGYSRYVTDITAGDGCEINHCAKASALAHLKLPAIKRPPFVHAPVGTPLTENVFVFDPAQNLWLKNEKAVAANKSFRPLPVHGKSSHSRFWPSRHGHQQTKEEVIVVEEGRRADHHQYGSDSRSGLENNSVVLVSYTVLVLLAVAVLLNIILVAALLRRRGGHGHGNKGKCGRFPHGLQGFKNPTLSTITVDEKRKN